MLKIIGSAHIHFPKSLKTHFKNPNFPIPNSHFYTSMQALISDSDQKGPNVEQFDQKGSTKASGVSHPWFEWVELMEQLSETGYLEENGNTIRKRELNAKDVNKIRTACLNFARDSVDLIGYFSKTDMEVVAGSGCPIIDRKVVNAGKRLRAHVGIDEGNVCSSCILRGTCERAYVKVRKSTSGSTVDVVRFLLPYGLDHTIGMLGNDCWISKKVMESVKRLLKQINEYLKEMKLNPLTANRLKWNSMLQESAEHQRREKISISVTTGEWICFKCKFKKFGGSTSCSCCHGRMRKAGKGQDHPAQKKGDWLCEKCKFMNFAKNSRCLYCCENPPKRQLHGGEWECDSCNYINFRRNIACIRCNHRQSKVSFPS